MVDFFYDLLSTRLLTGLWTDPIFLDRIPDPDPFEKLDLILHYDPLAFSRLPIRSDPFYFKGNKDVFPFGLVNLIYRKP
jgi:hypothetical protein